MNVLCVWIPWNVSFHATSCTSTCPYVLHILPLLLATFSRDHTSSLSPHKFYHFFSVYLSVFLFHKTVCNCTKLTFPFLLFTLFVCRSVSFSVAFFGFISTFAGVSLADNFPDLPLGVVEWRGAGCTGCLRAATRWEPLRTPPTWQLPLPRLPELLGVKILSLNCFLSFNKWILC